MAEIILDLVSSADVQIFAILGTVDFQYPFFATALSAN
jgi:hypothetical protein